MDVSEELQRRPELRESVDLIPGALLSVEKGATAGRAAVEVLLASGYDGVAGAYDVRTDRLRVRIQHRPEKPTSEYEVISFLKAYLDSASLSIRDVEVLTTEDEFPILQLESRGGAWLRDDGVRECTSGWTVEGPDGDGIITAGHCSGLNEYKPPGGTAFQITWRDQVLGHDGDVEYHTTNRVEVPRFYASAGVVRDVTSIRATNTMVGRNVCVYGRSSNTRTCDHQITVINETVGIQLPNGSVKVRGGLVEATNTSTEPGDSGGGWSWSTQAFGTHVGQGGGYSYFFPVEAAETALGVTILTN